MLKIFGLAIAMALALALAACGDDGGSGGKLDAPPSGGDGPPSDGPLPGDGPMTPDAPPVAAGPACGAVTCTLGQQDCCIGVVNACKPTGTCPSQGFACDGPEDCPNAVCCYPNQNNGSRCQSNNCQAIACHADTDCPTATPRCCAKPFTPSYKVCQVQC
jgi:hypothetical protein